MKKDNYTDLKDFPSSKDIKAMKNELKTMIDLMPREEFLDFVCFLMDIFEDDQLLYEDDFIIDKKMHSDLSKEKSGKVLSFTKNDGSLPF